MSVTLEPAAAPAAEPGALRNTDWRYLLPRPPEDGWRHLVLLGASHATVERVRSLGLARRTSLTLDAAHDADAVVALRGAHAPLRTIARALASGGALYLEVDRRTPGRRTWSPRRVRRMLSRLGVEPGAVFAVWPSLGRPRVCIPVSTPRPLAWFVDTCFMAHSPWRRVAEAAVRAVTRLDGRRLQPFLPQFVVIARARDGAGDDVVPAALDAGALPDYPAADPALVFGGNRVVVLPFPRGGGDPRVVLKVPKLGEFNERSDNERNRLLALRALADERVRAGIPEPLDTVRSGPVSISTLRFSGGALLSRTSSRWGAGAAGKVADLRSAAGWLASFHREALVRRAPFGVAEQESLVAEPLDAYRAAFGVTVLESGLFARVSAHANALAGVELPMVCMHRDYNVWNIAHRGSGIMVFDWEGAREGPALCDLLHFVTHWHEHVRHSRGERARLRDFVTLHLAASPRGWAVRAARESVAAYCAALELDARFVPLLHVYLWVELALRRLAQRRAEGGAAGGARADNPCFARIAALAAHADLLFGAHA